MRFRAPDDSCTKVSIGGQQFDVLNHFVDVPEALAPQVRALGWTVMPVEEPKPTPPKPESRGAGLGLGLGKDAK